MINQLMGLILAGVLSRIEEANPELPPSEPSAPLHVPGRVPPVSVLPPGEDPELHRAGIVEAPRLIAPLDRGLVDNGRSDGRDGIVWDFDWTDVPGATGYELSITGPRGPWFSGEIRERIEASSYRLVWGGAWIPNDLRHRWSWKVRASAGTEVGPWSEERRIVVQPVDSDRTFEGGEALDFQWLALQQPGPESISRFADPKATGKVLSLAFSPDGRFLATGALDGIVRLWEVETRVLVDSLRFADGPVTAVEFSPGGRSLVAGTEQRTIRVWDLDRKRLTITLTGHEAPVDQVALGPEARLAASTDRAGEIRIWDIETGKVKSKIQGPTGSWYLAFSGDGSRLEEGFSDAGVGVWDWDLTTLRGKRNSWIAGEGRSSRLVAYDPDHDLGAVANLPQSQLYLFGVKNQEPKHSFIWGGGPIRALRFSPDGHALAIAVSRDVLWFDLAVQGRAEEQRRRQMEPVRFALAARQQRRQEEAKKSADARERERKREKERREMDHDK